jgi:hypothetical protein
LLIRDGGDAYVNTSRFFFLKEDGDQFVPSASLEEKCYFRIKDGDPFKNPVSLVFANSGNMLALEIGNFQYLDSLSRKNAPY